MKQQKSDLNARMNLTLKKHQKDFKHKRKCIKCIECFADGYLEGELYYYSKLCSRLKDTIECFAKVKNAMITCDDCIKAERCPHDMQYESFLSQTDLLKALIGEGKG